jgi:hypothetical protein
VFRPHPNAREVSRRVARLPLDYVVSRLGDHWIVLGPTGLFVVGRAGDDLTLDANTTLALAHRIRAHLSDAMPWVPFIDALLVTAEEDLSVPCTVVDIATLEMALLSGPVSIDDVGLAQLRRHLPTVLERIAASAEVGLGVTAPFDPA